MEEAIKKGDLSEVKRLLATNAPTDPETLTSPLHIACKHKQLAVAKFLIDQGHPVNILDASFDTPFNSAARTESLPLVALLLDHGAEIDEDFVVPLDGPDAPTCVAISPGWEDIALMLLERGKRLGSGFSEGLKKVLEEKRARRQEYGTRRHDAGAAKVENALLAKRESSKGEWRELCLYVLRKQVEEDIDLMSPDPKTGCTALHLVLQINNLEALNFLVEKGVSVKETMRKNGETPLHVVASLGYLEGVEFILDHGADVDAPMTNGETPLHRALYYPKVVQLLLDRGADLEAQARRPQLEPYTMCSLGCEPETKECFEHRSWSALHLAVMLPAKETTELLLDMGADLEALDGEGRSVLCNALAAMSEQVYDDCASEVEPMFRMLLDRGPKNTFLPPEVARRALYMTAAEGSEDIVQFLIACGGHIEAPEVKDNPYRSPRSSNPTWTNPLFAAARSKNVNIVRLLIDAGMDANARDLEMRTPLHFASHIIIPDEEDYSRVPRRALSVTEVMESSYACTKALLDAGADINAVDLSGLTPLHLASSHTHTLLAVNLLLERGAQTNVLDKYGQTPLFNAAGSNSIEIIQVLLAAGLDMNAQDQEGDTVLHLAAQYNCQTSLNYFLSLGMNINLLNKSNETPLIRACQNRSGSLVSYLLSLSANPNLASTSGWTPLMYAAEWHPPGGNHPMDDHVSPLYPLLDAGANPNAKTIDNWTALHQAIRLAVDRSTNHRSASSLDAITALLNHGAEVSIQGTAPKHERWIEPHIPFHRALEYRDLERDPNSETVGKESPLHIASGPSLLTSSLHGSHHGCEEYPNGPMSELLGGRRLEILTLLLTHKPELNPHDIHGATPLHRATAIGSHSLSLALLNAGANSKATDNKARTPLHWAHRNGVSAELVELLKERGADEWARDGDGKVPGGLIPVYVDRPFQAVTRGRGGGLRRARGGRGRGRGGMRAVATWEGVGVEVLEDVLDVTPVDMGRLRYML